MINFKEKYFWYKKVFKIKFLRNKRLRALDQWRITNGDETLRINYELNSSSIVFDIGGYHGDFAEKIFNKYNCNIYIFEPVYSYYNNIAIRFSGNKKIKIYNFGFSDKNSNIKININNDASSIFSQNGEKQEIILKDIIQFLEENNIEYIDLMKINIEGGEFQVLPKLIEKKWINKISNIQIQFHDFIKNAKSQRFKIREELKKTHYLTYDFWFVWENWKRR